MAEYSADLRAAAPDGSGDLAGDKKTIDALLKTSDPESVAAAGRAYQQLAEAYGTIGEQILALRNDLHEAWQGAAASAAQSQLREVWAASHLIHQAASNVGGTLERHGSEYLAWYKYNKPPSRTDAEAHQWMLGANDRVTETWSAWPTSLTTSLPQLDPSRGGHDPVPAAGGGSPSSGGGAEGTSGARSYGGGQIAPPHSGSGSGAHIGPLRSGGPLGGGTHLAGYHPGPGGGQSTPLGPDGLGIGGGGSSGGGAGLFPGGVVGGPGQAGSGILEPGGRASVEEPGLSGVIGEENALAAEEAAAAERGATGMMGRGGPMYPMNGGHGAGHGEHERSRTTWLSEDEETWTGDVSATPGVIDQSVVSGVKAAPPAEPEEQMRKPDEAESTAELLKRVLARLERIENQGVMIVPSQPEIHLE